jgi:hypothetical protein
MSDKKRFAKKCLEQWVSILGLEHYVIKMSLSSRLKWENQSQEWLPHSDGSAGVYRIRISLSQPDEYVDWSIFHELTHIVTDPTYNMYYDAVGGTRGRSRAQARNFKSYNSQENIVIEHFGRIVYRLLDKTYPPHRAKNGEIVVGPAVLEAG